MQGTGRSGKRNTAGTFHHRKMQAAVRFLQVFYKEDTEFYMPLNEVLFMETDGNAIQVHTRDDIYQTRYKLYELEELLPGQFMRVSKSAILNTSHVYSITKNLSSSSVVQFRDTHK